MSDLSGQRLWQHASPEASAASLPIDKHDVRPDELRFLRLRSPSQIAEVIPLRRAIALPAAAQADPGFTALEKKETSWGWSGHSNTRAG